MILLVDIGNTRTHVALANARRVTRQTQFATAAWFEKPPAPALRGFVGRTPVTDVALCSVVPRTTAVARRFIARWWRRRGFELTAQTLAGLDIDYPEPETIGPDRLANALAAKTRFGAPAVVVDFGTAVTFDVVDARGKYVGGIIAPGLAAMTDYLHEKTALLPRIRIREVAAVIGKSTAEAMQIGAVRGYRGLIRELVLELKRELGCRRLPVVATGGYARLMAAGLPEITALDPRLTLDGLRLALVAHRTPRGYQERPFSLPSGPGMPIANASAENQIPVSG